jgi:hypothetical protein
MTPSPALQNLFYPVDPTEIAEAASSGLRLHRKTERAAGLARLLPWETLNTLITSDALASGRVSMARQGRSLPLEMVGAAGRSKSGDWIAPDAFQNLCHQGASLVLNGVERQAPAIAAMNAMIERYVRCETITNAYASFNLDSAFKAHFDPHDVLIVQLHGRKRWWCYGQIEQFPLKARAFANEELPPPEWEGVLEPGDILFVPRGDVHRALVEGPNSLHLTVTMTPPSGADVLGQLARRSLRETLGRSYLPVSGDADLRREHQENLKTMFHRLVDAFDIDSLLAELDRARAPASPFNLGLMQALEPGTEVQPALRRRLDLPESNGADVRVELGGAVVTLLGVERDVLATLLEADALTMEQLSERLPGTDVYGAVAGLARKAMVFLFAPA